MIDLFSSRFVFVVYAINIGRAAGSQGIIRFPDSSSWWSLCAITDLVTYKEVKFTAKGNTSSGLIL